MKKYKYTKDFTFNKHRYKVYGDTLEEIGRKHLLKIQELEKQKIKETKIRVSEYVPQCIDRYKTGQAESTRKEYHRGIRKGIIDHIGYMYMTEVTPEICQDILNLQTGRSKSQINLIYNGLKFIFSHAYAEGKIQKNPTLNLKKPKGTYTPRRALTPQEREVLISIAKTDRKYYCFLLMLLCGCRPTEACLCKGSDISLIDGTPTLHIRGTKTKNADRIVPIPDELYKLIKKTKKDDYISLYSNGNPILTKDSRRKLWRGLWYKMNIKAGTKTYRNRLLEPYIIPKDLTPYSLRHEYCSDLARRKIDIRYAQKLMGHSTIQMTANIYTHIENENIVTEVAKKLNT